jgi:MoaA/NifB/PqqE/SkfB family radical SAM enzyme
MNLAPWSFFASGLKSGGKSSRYWDPRSVGGAVRAAWTVLRNLTARRLSDHEELCPLCVVWHVTLRCNLACAFCDDGTGREYPGQRYPELGTPQAFRLLELLREASASVCFTGGEPFVRGDFPELVHRARALRFWPILVNTNGSLRGPIEQSIGDIDVLVVSLGATDPARYDAVIGRPGKTESILKTLAHCTRLQAAGKLRVVVNCVVCADRIPDARAVLAFCLDHGLWFSPAPEVRGLHLDLRLFADPEYESLVADTLAAKRVGAPVYGSLRQLDILLQGRAFRCYPALTPRIYPNGDLFHPCHPLGRHAANVLNEGSFRGAWRLGARQPPSPIICGDRCHLPCYVNNTQWIEHPLEMVLENARVIGRSMPFGVSRGAMPRRREARGTDGSQRTST